MNHEDAIRLNKAIALGEQMTGSVRKIYRDLSIEDLLVAADILHEQLTQAEADGDHRNLFAYTLAAAKLVEMIERKIREEATL